MTENEAMGYPYNGASCYLIPQYFSQRQVRYLKQCNASHDHSRESLNCVN